MGGGNLNLKKSWHPSTLKNQERVWKAQQQNEMEQKKLDELKKELQSEKEREELQGIVDKNKGLGSGNKLGWMYQGVSGLVDREDYLTGRKVDKTFDVIDAHEKASSSREDASKKEEGLPGQLFKKQSEISDGDFTTVDMGTKVREDPLYLIKKQEYEAKKQIVTNPVKMKMLKEMIGREKGKKKSKKEKKKKSKKSKKRDSSSSSSSSEEEPEPRRRQERSRSRERERRSNRDDDRNVREGEKRGGDEERRRYDVKGGRNDHEGREGRRDERGGRYGRDHERRRSPRRRSRSRSRSPNMAKKAGYGLIKLKEDKKDGGNEEYKKVDYRSLMEEKKRKEEKEKRELERKLKERKSRNLSEKERLEKLEEMKRDAKVRDKEREAYVKEHGKADAINVVGYEEGGFKGMEMLSKGIDSTSVERRIKSNMKHVQRAAMESSFVRR